MCRPLQGQQKIPDRATTDYNVVWPGPVVGLPSRIILLTCQFKSVLISEVHTILCASADLRQHR